MQTARRDILRRARWAVGAAVFLPYGLLVLWALGLPLDSALALGGDDGFELCKSALVARRPDLAPQMWNDQPWLHTLLHGTLFRWVGEHAALPRLFSLVSLGALLGAATHLLRGSLNGVGGLALSGFLLAGEWMPTWSVAAMLELPAISWALAAAALAATPPGAMKRWRWMAAGVLLALACHLKFTALVVLPAWLAMIRARKPARHRGATVVWTALGFVLAFSLLVRWSPSFDLESLILPHLPLVSGPVAAEMAQYRPRWAWILGDPAPLLAALFALAHPGFKRRRAARAFTLVLLGTAAAVALGHRPWWQYYLIHFQIPLAMLGAVGVTWLSRRLRRAWRESLRADPPAKSGLSAPAGSGPALAGLIMSAAAVAALWGGFALPRMMQELKELNDSPTAQSSRLVQTLRRYQDRIRWCYTEDRTAAFHAGVLIPPELVVLSRKRFWHGYLDEQRRANWIRFYAPEALIIPEARRRQNPAFARWLDRHYKLCAREYNLECWLSESLNPEPLPTTEHRLELFGL